MKISNKINLTFVTIFGFLFITTSLIVVSYTIKIFRTKVSENLYYSGRILSEHVKTYLNEQKITAGILAEASVFRDFLKESSSSAQYKIIKAKVDSRLLRTINVNNNLSEVFILSKDGKVLSSSDKNQEGKDKSQDDYFINAQKEIYIKDIYFSQITNKINYTVSAPIKDEKNNLLGISVLRLNTNGLNNILKNFGYPDKTKEAFLINKDLYFLTSSLFLGDSVILNKIVDTKNARDCFDTKELDRSSDYQTIESTDYRQVDVIGTHNYIPETKWCLITKIDKSEFLSTIKPINNIFMIALIAIIILLIIIGNFVAKQISKPINKLNQGVKTIGQGNLDFKVDNNSKDEIGELSRSFDQMANDLKDYKENVEAKITQKTADLQEINRHMINRELKMIELKQKIREVEKKNKP